MTTEVWRDSVSCPEPCGVDHVTDDEPCLVRDPEALGYPDVEGVEW